MRRRDFIVGFGSAAAWPSGSHAQQPERMRRVGFLMGLSDNDPELPLRVTVFRQELQKLGWTEARNIRIDFRWTAGDMNRWQVSAKELIGLAPDVIVAQSTTDVIALRRESQSVPIVFVQASNPVSDLLRS